ncbi:MAG: glycosyltransferase [Candidatus Pacebacteria bacterium]|nr:glycosyltransferase [Candidatus Paceibacterota bacterium]
MIIMGVTISIVTPSYNQGRYIEETIKSVLSQAGNFFVEYIIADARSTDETVRIIKKYDELLKSGRYPIKCKGVELLWWSKKDRGQSDAINQGFKIAKGDIVAWINSDDYYLPGTFQLVASRYKKKPFDLLYGDCAKLYATSNILATPKPNPNESYQTLLSSTGTFGQPATFFTKKIIERVGYIDESLHYCMDYDLWIRIFKIGKVVYLPNTLAVFRIWENSKTTTSQQKFDDERRLIAKHYGGNILTPRKIYHFIDKFKWRHYIKNKFPYLYFGMKRVFFHFIDLLKYRTKK